MRAFRRAFDQFITLRLLAARAREDHSRGQRQADGVRAFEEDALAQFPALELLSRVDERQELNAQSALSELDTNAWAE